MKQTRNDVPMDIRTDKGKESGKRIDRKRS